MKNIIKVIQSIKDKTPSEINRDNYNRLMGVLRDIASNPQKQYDFELLGLEFAKCEVEGLDLCIKMGTYYFEIPKINSAFFDISNIASEMYLYTANKNNPDGAVMIIEFVFKDIWCDK